MNKACMEEFKAYETQKDYVDNHLIKMKPNSIIMYEDHEKYLASEYHHLYITRMELKNCMKRNKYVKK